MLSASAEKLEKQKQKLAKMREKELE